MMPEDIIIEPIITEKSNDGLQEGKYTFKVNKKATKVDIARAVEKLFEFHMIINAYFGHLPGCELICSSWQRCQGRLFEAFKDRTPTSLKLFKWSVIYCN